MKNGERIKRDVEKVSKSECVVSSLDETRKGEDIDDAHDGDQSNSGKTSNCSVKPVTDGR